jgi:peptidoglycan/xylan/chitin deacetylase (PgdA/CDA1 family)
VPNVNNETPRIPPAATAILAIAALTTVAVVAHWAFLTVPVTVDGSPIRAMRDAELEEVVAKAGSAKPGDLLAATDHRVVMPGGGVPALVIGEGERGAHGRVRGGDRILTLDGPDTIEPLRVETRTIEPPVRQLGSGGFTRATVSGSPGEERIVSGMVSGDVVETAVLREPTATVVRHARSAKHVIALTFDDGPWPGQTERVLDILRAEEVPATFFVLGARVNLAPTLTRRIAEEGHLIGNHSFSHQALRRIPRQTLRAEIVRTQRAVAGATGATPRWFRAPGGRMDAIGYIELGYHGLRSALWTVDAMDWEPGVASATITHRVLASARPGSVVLLHDGGGDRSATIQALPAIIAGLRDAGYDFVTLDEIESVRSRW